MKRLRIAAALGLATTLMLAAGCGSDDAPAAAGTAAPAVTAAPDATGVPVATDAANATENTEAPVGTEATASDDPAICPTDLVIQTDWWPELVHGGAYQLIGPDGDADAESFVYSGPIADAYAVGGIETVEVRSGGDAVGFVPNQSLLQSDDDILFALVNINDVMKTSAEVDLVAVAKTLELDPQMIMWDPTQNPIERPEDIAATGAQVLHFDGTGYIDYMIAKGYMTSDQSNPSYGGAPDQWIAEGGNFFQQGYSTSEVYQYEQEIAWKDGAPADVDYYTVGDIGIPNYAGAMVMRRDRVEDLRPCLEVLVPKLAQGWVDYLADPKPVNDSLIDIADEYNTYWKLSEGLQAFGIETVEADGIGANSFDGTYCSFDPERIETLAEIFRPVYEADGVELVDDLTAVYTNEFCEGAPGR